MQATLFRCAGLTKGPCDARRGDVDDRVLCEAILPLLQALAGVPDVRPVLHRRFDMPRWFMSQVCARLSERNPECLFFTCRYYPVPGPLCCKLHASPTLKRQQVWRRIVSKKSAGQ